MGLIIHILLCASMMMIMLTRYFNSNDSSSKFSIMPSWLAYWVVWDNCILLYFLKKKVCIDIWNQLEIKLPMTRQSKAMAIYTGITFFFYFYALYYIYDILSESLKERAQFLTQAKNTLLKKAIDEPSGKQPKTSRTKSQIEVNKRCWLHYFHFHCLYSCISTEFVWLNYLFKVKARFI